MLELSPSVATTAASAPIAPAASRMSLSIPCPTTKPPFQAPSRERAFSSSSTHVTSHPSSASFFATAEPTRPQPMITACKTGRSVAFRGLLERALGERYDEHLAGGVAQDVVHRRREEPGLPTPARRGAEHDQVGAVLTGLVDDCVPDRPG